MKIGSKIALFYTGITICMLTCIMVVFYFFIYNYINRLYDSYLADKAYLTAQKHWEKDEVVMKLSVRNTKGFFPRLRKFY